MKVADAVPQYPADLNAAKVGGVVILEVLVDVNGNVNDVTVLRSPNPGLEQAAIDAVRQWKYTPDIPELRAGRDAAERDGRVQPSVIVSRSAMVTPGGATDSSGTKKSGISGSVGSTRYLSKSRSPSP